METPVLCIPCSRWIYACIQVKVRLSTEWKVSEVDKRVYDPPERFQNVYSHAAYTYCLNCAEFPTKRKAAPAVFTNYT